MQANSTSFFVRNCWIRVCTSYHLLCNLAKPRSELHDGKHSCVTTVTLPWCVLMHSPVSIAVLWPLTLWTTRRRQKFGHCYCCPPCHTRFGNPVPSAVLLRQITITLFFLPTFLHTFIDCPSGRAYHATRDRLDHPLPPPPPPPPGNIPGYLTRGCFLLPISIYYRKLKKRPIILAFWAKLEYVSFDQTVLQNS